MNKKNRFFDLNGFDVVLQLPAFFLFTLLVTIPLTACMLTIFMREAIEQHASYVMLGIFVLTVLGYIAFYLSAGALSNGFQALLQAWSMRHQKSDTNLFIQGGEASQQPFPESPTPDDPRRLPGRETRRQWVGSRPQLTSGK